MNIQKGGRLVQGAPVREYATAEEMRRHAAELRARMMGAPPPRPAVIVREALPAPVSIAQVATPPMALPVDEDTSRIQAEREAFRPDVPDMRVLVSRPRAIIQTVAKHHGVTVAALKSEARPAHVVKPRQLAMVAVWIECPIQSLPSIGRLMGGRDHTTVLHALRKYGVGKVREWPAELFWLRDLVAVPPVSNEEGCA